MCAVLAAALLVALSASAAGAVGREGRVAVSPLWQWPLDAFRLERPYVAPPDRYGAGHRGVDVRPVGSTRVTAPAAGVIAFAGPVADRSLVTIDHGGGLVTTLEPITPGLAVGELVAAGAPVGVVSAGGHVEEGSLHIGVRLHGEYINPLILLGAVPRAVLLPCCEPTER
ncbi:M23 family metallopeptidase [Microbacterium hominis]|uniref:M23 family metallopeptidase n=2 Tax=Microbacterium hominis TaxID=162426 RepID=A0A7D4Q3S0_9MICO|nr:M23 family metallopeptidase [Microbacterium hominis]